VEHLFVGWMDDSEIHFDSDCCALGVSCKPCNNDQFWVWIKLCLPNGKLVYAVRLAAVSSNMVHKKCCLF
jgi:hypothetical protein